MYDDFYDFYQFLNIPNDGSFKITDVQIIDNVKYIHIHSILRPCFCPVCSSRMHSNGLHKRKANHPILQDTFKLYLIVHQRQWICPNCKKSVNESFSFLDRYSHSTNMTFFYVLEATKDLNRSTASIARQFNMSDTQVHDIFTAHVDLPALPLPEVISIDEVFLDINSKSRYAFVIMDFITGQIVDIVQNRWMYTLHSYFQQIPLQQREKVRYIISDAYQNYLMLPEYYFPNAVSVLDSFHVIKNLNGMINSYINSVMKRYKDRDRERLRKKNHDLNLDNESIRDSKEVALLRDYRWILLKNRDEINYSSKLYYHKKLQMNVDTYRIESMFMALDRNFNILRELKEMYTKFNDSIYLTEEELENNLDRLIKIYSASDNFIFIKFAAYLNAHKQPILNSFNVLCTTRRTHKELQDYYSRLSNGPMESFNRKPKDFKRNSRGFFNFDYTRNRILWATRENPPYLGIPKTREQVHAYRGKKRGKYKKQLEINEEKTYKKKIQISMYLLSFFEFYGLFQNGQTIRLTIRLFGKP